MDKSTAAAASKKKPALSSRLVGRTGSRGSSNRSTAAANWSSRTRPPERLDWPTLTGGNSSVVGASVATNNSAAAAPIQPGKFIASTCSQESWPPPANSSKRQRRPVRSSLHHHFSTQASTFSQQQSPPPTHTSLGGDGLSMNESSSSSSTSNNALWTIKYAPRQPSDLVVAPKKVEQVASWIQSTLDGTSRQRLLVLVGSPGIGKSSMIHCLAASSGGGGFHVLEWSESFMTTRTNHETWQQQQYQNGNGFMAVEQPSPLYSFEAFLQQAAVGYSPLTLQTSSSSTSQHSVLSQQQQRQQSKRPFSSLSQPQRKMAPSTSSNNNNSNNNSGLKSVILLDELPHCHDDEAQHKFRHLLTNHIENSVLPVILIFSNVLEGKHKPEDLEQFIESRVLYAPHLTTILQIHAATKVRLKKCLQHICQQEGIPATSSSKQKLQYDLYQDLHFRSGGDVRFAITTLQYEYACHHNPLNNTNNNNKNGTSATKKKKSNTVKTTTCAIPNESSSSERDQKLSMFHALGKLLYAKREPQNTSLVSSIRHQTASGDGEDHRPPLTFDPEGVVEHCGIEVAGALSFLGYHSLDFFTDVEELSQAWDLFSDATYWLDRPTMDGSWYRSLSSSTASSAFPVGYASSLAGRAVACTNFHPAPHKFRQFSAPPVFEVLRKRRDNTSQIRHFQSRFDMLTMITTTTTTSSNCNNSHGVSGLSHCHPNEFATDLAYVRMILPPEVVAASQLQSHFNSVPALQRRQQEEQETAAALLQEQEEVLRDDDIMDFDEDDSNNTNNHQDNEGIATNKLTAGRPAGVAMSLGTENNKPSPTSSIENIPVASAMVKVRFK